MTVPGLLSKLSSLKGDGQLDSEIVRLSKLSLDSNWTVGHLLECNPIKEPKPDAPEIAPPTPRYADCRSICADASQASADTAATEATNARPCTSGTRLSKPFFLRNQGDNYPKANPRPCTQLLINALGRERFGLFTHPLKDGPMNSTLNSTSQTEFAELIAAAIIRNAEDPVALH